MRTKSHRKYKRTSTEHIPKRLSDGLTIIDAFENFIRVKEIEGLAPRTLSDHRVTFRYFREWLNQDISIKEVSIQLIRDYIHHMLYERKLANSTVNIRIRPLRAFLRFCFRESVIDTPVYEQIKLLKVEEDQIESFTKREVRALLNQPNAETYAGFRDYVMMVTLLETGLRSNELLNIKIKHIDFKTHLIDVPASIAKSRRFRQVPITKKVAHLLAELAEEVEEFHTEYVFVSYQGEQFEASTWRSYLKEYGRNASIVNKRVSPHTFRHTFALFYIMNGGDPFSLQRILGHSTMAMVRKYIQMAPEDLKTQHTKYSPLEGIL